MFYLSKPQRNEGLLVVATTILLVLMLSASAAHAQTTGLYTQYDSVIEYQTTSGYTPENVNVTWTNTNSCGSFSGFGAGGTWYYGPGVGATPCTSSLPSGTITETASSDGTVLASCTDTQGAADYGSYTATGIPSECTTTGAGVSISGFYAQAFDASGNPIAAGSSGNDDWIIAAVVVIILVLLLLFFYIRRRRTTSPAATAAAQAASAPPGIPPGIPPASAGKFCAGCGSPVESGAAFCPNCGKAL
jgi:hypothetical protein